jgi:adenylate cyclase
MNSFVNFDSLEVAESKLIKRSRVLILCGSVVFLCLFLWWLPVWHLLEDQARDALSLRFLVSKTKHDKVALVDFSDSSIQALGGWPLPRQRMADLVEELIGPLGAKVVGLDILFPEATDPAGDARLASLAEHGPLVLSHVLDVTQRNASIRVGIPARATPPSLMNDIWPVQESHGYVANHAGLAQARCVGHIGVLVDGDGIVRRLSPLVSGPQGVLSTLSIVMLECGDPKAKEGVPPPLVKKTSEGLVGMEAEYAWRLPFTYGFEAFDAVDAADVLAGTVDANRLRGKYVLVGSSAVGLSDYVNTPLQALTPGVLVHAQALAQLLDHEIPRPIGLSRWLNVAAALLGASCIALIWRRHKLEAWGLGVFILVMWPLLAFAGLAQGIFLQVLYVPAVCLGGLVAVSAFELKLLRDVKLRALSTLSHYVAQPVLEQLYAAGLMNSLKPKLCEITVLVVDMKNFTSLTEKMSLNEIATLMRDLMELITQPVLELEGTLVQYTGDGLIAFWGAPLQRPDHASMALQCAGAMQSKLQRWNSYRKGGMKEDIGIRLGIESGIALVGDLGSSSRRVYSAIGGCINTASRLQELGRDLKCDLVVGPAAAVFLIHDLKPVALANVKGLRSPLQVYTWKQV